MRDVARAAGVSPMTVSLALRAHARIPAATRERVIAAARRLGYCLRPEVAHLMRAMRSRKLAGPRAVVLVVADEQAEGPNSDYTRRLLRGVERGAEQRGMGVARLAYADLANRPRRLADICQGKGIDGVVFLPAPQPVDLSAIHDWRRVALVAASLSILGPRCHRVGPHVYAHMWKAIPALESRGYRRIGLVWVGKAFAARIHDAAAAALVLRSSRSDLVGVATLEVERTAELTMRFGEWLKRERPDLVVTNAAEYVLAEALKRGVAVPGEVGVFSLGPDDRNAPYAGISLAAESVGNAAMDMLAELLQRGERGVPAEARAILVEGDLKLTGTVQ